MKRYCKNCRWWQKTKIGEPKTCCNVDSDNRFDATAEDYSCNHWMPEIEQDGFATWNLHEK